MNMHGVKNSHLRIPAHRSQTHRAKPAAEVNTHPYEGSALRTVSVKVDGWKKGPNDCLVSILRGQGYSETEIYARDAEGQSLIDRVARVNGLKDPNLVVPGRKLLIPTQRPRLKADTRKGAEVLRDLQQRPAPSRPSRPATAAEILKSPELSKAESLEVDLLTRGVKEGKFSEPEFQALNSTANQFTELRARYARSGFTPAQQRQLNQVQQQYGQMYQRFLADDKVNIRFSGENSSDPAARFRTQQNQQAAALYRGYQEKRLDDAELKNELLLQRGSASQFGLQAAPAEPKKPRPALRFHKHR